MYERVRTELMGRLSAKFPVEDIQSIMSVFDRVMADYEVTAKETAIQVYDNSLRETAKMYIMCRRTEGIAKGSILNIKYTLDRFINAVGKPLEEITTNDVRVYLIVYQQQNNTSPVTLDKIRERLNRYFTWCVEEGYITINPMRRVAKIKAPKSERHALSEEELEFCRNSCKTLRDKAMLEVLYSTGARVAEIANLNLSDIDWQNSSAKVFGKNSEYYTVYFNAKARVALRRYLNSRDDSCPALFVTNRKPIRRMCQSAIRNAVEEIGKRAEISKVVSPHIMRHTMATMALQHGTPLEVVQRMLNHKSPATTQIYAEMDRTAVAAAHKRAVI